MRSPEEKKKKEEIKEEAEEAVIADPEDFLGVEMTPGLPGDGARCAK